MKQIIIPENEVGKYTRMINKYQMIQPIPVETDKGVVYTLPPEILKIERIDKFFNKLVALGEVDTAIKDMPIQDIKITGVEEINKNNGGK